MFDDHGEGVFGVGHVVGARIAREFDGDVGVGGGIFGVVGPGAAGIVGDDVCGIERHFRIADAIEALGTLHAEAQTPEWLGAMGDDQDGVMLRGGRLHFGRCGDLGRGGGPGRGGFGSRLLCLRGRLRGSGSRRLREEDAGRYGCGGEC